VFDRCSYRAGQEMLFYNLKLYFMLKKTLKLTIALFIIGNSSFAQWDGPGSNNFTGPVYRYGNVGIGTANPGAMLHINLQNYGSILLGDNSNGGVAITKETDNRLAFWNSGIYGQSQEERFTIMQNGNVGIGTRNPQAQLHIKNSQNYGSILLGDNSNGGVAITKELDNRLAFWNNGIYGQSQAERFTILQNGYIGIGISNPGYPLDVRGNIYTNGSVIVDGGDLILARTTNDYGFIVRPNIDGKKNLAFAVEGGVPLDVVSVNSNLSYFSGSIGIGTTNFAGAYKLAVEGKIAARGLKVTNSNFADYVFDSTYQLRPLFSVEKFINQHKHLPGIPSAAEVEKEGGVEVGEMQVKLLEKIEELTLYVIELKKENELMKEELKKLTNKKQ
jgi:hypothetical protein